MIVTGRLKRSVPAQQQSFLAFDFGEKRTGVASGTRLTQSSTPLQTIHTAVSDVRFAQIEKLLREWQPDADSKCRCMKWMSATAAWKLLRATQTVESHGAR
jgi:hypothetical protein